MKISEYIAEHSDDYDYDEATGDLIIGIGSSMLSGVTVDTYSTFTSDNFEENEINYFSENVGDWFDHTMARGKVIDLYWDDFEFHYDHKGILQGLSEAMAQVVMETVYFINDAKITSTFSPGTYNFATDSFEADWHIDIEEMISEIGDMDIEDIEKRARYDYASRSGFISYIPDHFDRRYSWTILWAYIDQYFADNYEDMWMGVFDHDYEIFSENIEMVMLPGAFRKVYEAIMEREAPETIVDEDTLTSALPTDYRQDERLF